MGFKGNEKNCLTKRRVDSSTPDLSLVMDDASNPIFGNRKQVTALNMVDFRVLHDWFQAPDMGVL